ncbi:hypothetical protein PLESTB_001787900 [Pleodorina starrii]|uniref:Uncharacterized protein n=1 Tax=Pleodorina starrii TaxID=330485 RepID=A0A9W6C1A3_9CHLO|nr:hypothetical protein PLESTM_001758200 [Pleodorina starrii]GLC61657.1 hypothetical protein PLESTB_001787900 [Pleodorina starrii]
MSLAAAAVRFGGWRRQGSSTNVRMYDVLWDGWRAVRMCDGAVAAAPVVAVVVVRGHDACEVTLRTGTMIVMIPKVGASPACLHHLSFCLHPLCLYHTHAPKC